MARLVRGENAKIDKINDLVELVKNGSQQEYADSVAELIIMFNPMILSICKKWSSYFDDEKHIIKPWDPLIADAHYWLILYTKDKYIIDGQATYNTFIKNHINQRIRYIYECELKYMKHNLMPDPNKFTFDGNDSFEDVVYNYSSIASDEISMDELLMDDEVYVKKCEICDIILSKLEDTQYFNVREKEIFLKCIQSGQTHEDVGRQLGISRTRVSQIVGKMKKKINEILDDNVREWWVVTK